MARRRTISYLLCLTGAVLAVGGALAGCGNSRTAVPRFGAPAPPGGVRLLPLLSDGVLLQVPRTWVVTGPAPPLLATVSSGTAAIAIWSYHRRVPAPLTRVQLLRARSALLRTARRRDPTLQPIRVAIVTLAGWGAVELDALEHVNGQLRRVRSVHVYQPGRELVLDAYAPPAIFHLVDHAVFSPAKRSLKFVGPGAA